MDLIYTMFTSSLCEGPLAVPEPQFGNPLALRRTCRLVSEGFSCKTLEGVISPKLLQIQPVRDEVKLE